MKNTTIKTEINNIIDKIKAFDNDEKIILAFSGGMDSSLVLFLAVEALGREKIVAVNVDFGTFTYEEARLNVKRICEEMKLELHCIDGEQMQKGLLKGGPDCNLCTRKIKLGLVKNFSQGRIVFTGSNQSDSWGKYGKAFSSGIFAPLFSYDKKEIKNMLDYLNIKVTRVGENINREGCKLKHLLKPLINPSFHGRAVSEANEILLQLLNKINHNPNIANVKIIGPLNKNIALININPLPEDENDIRMILENIANIDVIDSCEIVSQPLQLTVKANKGQFNNLRSRYWIEQGRLQAEFAAPLECRWLLTTNHRLKTFQVVDYSC